RRSSRAIALRRWARASSWSRPRRSPARPISPATISRSFARRAPRRLRSAPDARMPTHAERRRLPYRAEQLFDLVADVERYPEFLPWCLGARIRERSNNTITADLLIGFKM